MSVTMLSIDLGSSYTKIGFRTSRAAVSKMVKKTAVSMEGEYAYFIPSVVATVTSRGRSRTLVGFDAARQARGDGVTVHEDWKSKIFHPSASAVERKAGEEIALAFLTGIRKALEAKYKSDAPEILEMPVRVAIPKLDESGGGQDIIRRVLTESGWNSTQGRVCLYEPETNAIGMLTRGRNKVWKPNIVSGQRLPEVTINLQAMLEPGLSSAFRQMRDSYSILVTDIGAFTTDFGLVRFDPSFLTATYNKPNIVQHSVALGVRQLDNRVLELLPESVRSHFRERSVFDWESAKLNLYNGKPVQLPDGNVIGSTSELAAIRSEVRAFGKKIVDARAKFCRTYSIASTDEESLSGGGAKILPLREFILEALRPHAPWIHDLESYDEPERAVARGIELPSPRHKEERRKENAVIVRAATALGAASTFFDQS